jgi:serine/threonine-protein kinase
MESHIRHRLEDTAIVSPPTELQPPSTASGNAAGPPAAGTKLQPLGEDELAIADEFLQLARGTKLQSLGEYELLEVIGEGGMGRVYKARQALLNRLVAVKVLAPRLAEDRAFIKRFRREAAVAANLNHPNIVQVFTAGESGGVHYFVMELVDGESAQKRLHREGRMSAAGAIAICLQVAHGLDYAWREGQVIHRDIKPDNIFLSHDGKTKLGDLGLAKNVSEGASSVTMSGHVVGTPHYISPEQARGKKNVDFRSDIYSLGCTLYHMLTGRPPFSGDSMLDVILKHVHDPAPNIAEWIPDCPLGVDRLLAKMMAKDPDDRHQSYHELIVDLQQIQQGCGANILSVKPGKPAKRFLGFLTAALSSLNPGELSKRFVSFLTAGFSMLKPGKRWWQQLSHNLPAVLQSDQITPKARPSLPVVPGAILLVLLLVGGGGYLYVSFTTGVVKITTEPPEVEVSAGDKLVGTTPYQERAKPGGLAYGLKLDGYNEANIEVQAKAGRTTNVFVKMMPWSGELLGTSKPAGAKVAVVAGEGFKVETNTPFKVRVPVDSRMGGTATAEVTAQFGNLPAQMKSVVVEKGQRSAVEFVFACSGVHIESQPAGATVLLHGVEVGRTPYENHNVAPGKVTYELRLAGHNTDIVQLSVTENQTTRVVRQLTTVEVRSDPSGAEVLWEGVVLGQTPFTGIMEAGRQELIVRHPVLGELTLPVEVQQGKTVTKEVRFARGGVQLTSEPAGADVFIAGKLVGKTPYENPLMASGKPVTYEVRKEVGGKILSEALMLQVTDGQMLRTNVVLSSGRGVVALTCNLAGAKVYWLTKAGEQLVGETGAGPLRSKPIDKGLQKFVARHPVLGDQEVPVQVKADAEVAASVTFAFGSVVVRAVRADTGEPVAGAEVFGGGRRLGRAPWTNAMMRTGPVKFVVQAEDYVTKLVEGDVMAGRTNGLVAEMELGQGTLELKSDPPGAEAFLDNKPIGKLPLTTSASAGTHQLQVRYLNLPPQTKQVRLKKGQATREEFKFVLGSVLVRAEPRAPKSRQQLELKANLHMPASSPAQPMTNSVGMELVWVPGVPGQESGCWVGKHEVTQGEYEKIMGENPSTIKNPRMPVNPVSFNNAKAFCDKLNEKEAAKGVRYVLPTEEQWEYLVADADLKDAVTSKGLEQARQQPEVVGSTGKPNKFGLYDIRGNVWEWCDGPNSQKALRGGAFDNALAVSLGGRLGPLNLNYRQSRDPVLPAATAGFRVLVVPR